LSFHEFGSFQTVNESSDFAFVSPEPKSQSSWYDLASFYANHKHGGFLKGHAEMQETPVERSLEFETRLKEPR
jgi:hypothetical protein